ncbi:hypothetical protein CDAR_545171 [Caerostris darwini]|uniref:Uncharacterized protein n=1 Tax=Caerostris darwini TaxID=1538125 RepID=A0AAV4TL98_9ARAC|nr:hypothetical protein CDAR_545171 [Caerostris darwini]
MRQSQFVPLITIGNSSVRTRLMKETSIGCRCRKAVIGGAKVMDWLGESGRFCSNCAANEIDCIKYERWPTKTKGYLFPLPNEEQ